MSQGPQVRVSEDRRLLVERLAASTYFNKSARLRDLLVYLTERVLEDEAVEIHEQEVGHRVFGRARDYDTAADNIVRVHASMLRKRLDQYLSPKARPSRPSSKFRVAIMRPYSVSGQRMWLKPW